MNANASNSPITNEDKEKLINDLKETFKDAWVIGKKLLQPLIEFVNKKYDNISQEKKQKIWEIVSNAKECWEKWVWKIRELLWIMKK